MAILAARFTGNLYTPVIDGNAIVLYYFLLQAEGNFDSMRQATHPR